jgi:chemotaxis protein CheZ
MPDDTGGLAALRGDLTAIVESLLAELDGLGRIVSDARTEIAALKADDADAPDIPAATDELAAIVSHTAQATHEILDCCETLEQVAGRLDGKDAEMLHGAVTRIYESCSFQDITGQRIAKVVAALQAIERRIARARSGVAPGPAAQPSQAAPSLLNGPQLPGGGISQSAIDALFD